MAIRTAIASRRVVASHQIRKRLDAFDRETPIGQV
jgi:hypothetical protein